jgi:trigger factor
MAKHFKLSKVEKLPESEVVIEGEISEELLLKHRTSALKNIAKNAELPGFRKGHVPENIIIERYGEMTILGDAAEEALNEVYPEIIESEKLFVLGAPEVSITKLAKGNPLGFKIKVAIVPEFKLPDYKKIAASEMKKDDDLSVTEKEIDDVIKEIRGNFAHAELHKKIGTDNHDHAPIKDDDLPEFTDEFVKKIGDFKDVEDFRTKAKENIKREKQYRTREKKRMATLEETLAKTNVTVPKVLVESELAKMLAQFKDDVTRAGAQYEEYLKHAKKTEEDIRKEWRETAEKKAKVQLVLNKISEEEKISPDAEKVRNETEKLLLAYQGADPVRARAYVAQMLLNEKVMEFLEEQK